MGDGEAGLERAGRYVPGGGPTGGRSPRLSGPGKPKRGPANYGGERTRVRPDRTGIQPWSGGEGRGYGRTAIEGVCSGRLGWGWWKEARQVGTIRPPWAGEPVDAVRGAREARLWRLATWAVL